MTVSIYHNPRCSKSRQTLALLEENGVTPTVIPYLETPPTAADLKKLLGALNMTARDLMRKKETVYKDLNLSDSSLTESELLDAMINNPILIERPIVVNGAKAAIGRPPEAVLEIL